MNYIKSLAKQLGQKGIRVNGVAPGPIWTPLQISGGAPEEKCEKFGSSTVPELRIHASARWEAFLFGLNAEPKSNELPVKQGPAKTPSGLGAFFQKEIAFATGGAPHDRHPSSRSFVSGPASTLTTW